MSTLGEHAIARATAWRFGYLLSQAGLSFTLFVCLAQVLPADAFANAALAQAVLVLAQAIGDFGLSQAAAVALPARLAREPEREGELLNGAAAAFWLAAGAALVLTVAAVAVVPASARLPTLLIGPAAAASVLVSGADGMLRATGEFRRPVVLVTLSRAGGFLALPAAVISESAAWASVGLTIGTLALTLPAVRVVNARRGARHGSPAQLIRAAVPLGGAQVFVVGAGRLNTVILSALLSVRAAAAFEGAWRLFQLGQYVAGGLATGAAPFVGHAVGRADHARLRGMLARLTVTLAVAGVGFGVALALLGPWLSRQLLGDVGDEVGEVLLPFAVLSPLAFVGFLAFTTLGASEHLRRWVLIGYGVGATVAICLVVVLAGEHGVEGATTGCAIGWGIAQLVMIGALVLFLRRSDAAMAAAGGMGQVAVAPPERP